MSNNHIKRRLPALRSMQVFEAAARHGGFTEAARELNVTQGAVSRQVQELERWLNLKLFARSGPNVKLTGTGKALGDEIGRALDILQTAIETAKPSSNAHHVTLSMLPSVATKWLAPRLGQFMQSHPEIDLRITASRHLVNFEAEEIDAAIRYGKGNWPGVSAELLVEESITPVCTRRYAKNGGLKTPADLVKATLLHSDISENWEAWFQAAGIENIRVPRGPKLGDDAASLQAAIDSQGVALGRSVLVADDLKAGRLITPFPVSLRASFSYWLVTPAGKPDSANLHAVRKWLKQEFARCLNATLYKAEN